MLKRRSKKIVEGFLVFEGEGFADRVHGPDGDAEIESLDAEIGCHEGANGASCLDIGSSGVELVGDFVEVAEVDERGGGGRRRGVFLGCIEFKSDAFSEIRGVLGIVFFGKVRVEGVGDIE